MRLFEHPDFEQAMLRAAEHHGLSEQFIEKDYYITEILRICVGELGEKVVFKGGTSLSKGWGLITRFSEDVDLFVNPVLFDPPPGKNKLDRILKGLTETVARYPPLDWRREEGETIKGLGRNDVLAYESRFADLPGLRAAIRLEPGVQSGSFPTSEEPITSLLARYLQEEAVEGFLELDDIQGFDMHLLHFRRTFVEKMFALHGKVERLLTEGHPLGRDARHYSDLHVLAGQHEVRSMLASPEFEEIRLDYDERSRQFFSKSYRPPPELSFKDSPALFPDTGCEHASSPNTKPSAPRSSPIRASRASSRCSPDSRRSAHFSEARARPCPPSHRLLVGVGRRPVSLHPDRISFPRARSASFQTSP